MHCSDFLLPWGSVGVASCCLAAYLAYRAHAILDRSQKVALTTGRSEKPHASAAQPDDDDEVDIPVRHAI